MNKEEIVSVKNEKEGQESPSKKYEEILQKLEEESRSHIGIEQQLKLHIEALQEKVDEASQSIEKLKAEIKAKDEECNRLKEELATLIEKYKQIESMEDYNCPSVTAADQTHTQGSTIKHGKSQDFMSKLKGDTSKKVM